VSIAGADATGALGLSPPIPPLRRSPESPPFDPEETKRLILMAIAPPDAWVPFITELKFRQRGLRDLTPLAGLTALQTLDCSGTRVAALAPLAGLSGLQRLGCSVNLVWDLAPLAGLRAPQMLHCSYTRVSDLTPLAGLSRLQTLDCTLRSATSHRSPG
jgi:Leucine-rich repeat (LRR) protein